ncbi:hypothetical protein [Roseomonas sp. WA12]
MPDRILIKGSGALGLIKNKVGTLGDLVRLISNIHQGGNATSCNYTAQVLGDAVSTSAMTAPRAFGSYPSKDKVNIIGRLLDQPKLVYINISPDHHFIVIPLDADKVTILQGFQGVYNLLDWMQRRGDGVIRKSEFISHMQDLVSGDERRKLSAAARLFSFSILYEGAGPPPDKFALHAELQVNLYFRGKTVTIPAVGYKDL